MAGAGGPVAVARAWRITRAPEDFPRLTGRRAEGIGAVPGATDTSSRLELPGMHVDGYVAVIEWRFVEGGVGTGGTATAWGRQLVPLLPAGSLRARRGLPSVIVTRGLLAAAFFCAEAYIVYVLQERWGLSPGQAGVALTLVGIVWALASQVQSRLGERISHERAMVFGTAVVLAGVGALAVVVGLRSTGVALPVALPVGCYVLASVGMGFAYPRTSVAMLAASTDRDRGFNSSALSVADSLGAALALALAGVAYAVARDAGADPFPVVYVLASAIAVLGVLVATRTRETGHPSPRAWTEVSGSGI